MAKLPEFKRAEEEAAFWETPASTEYFEAMPAIDVRFVFSRVRAVPVRLAGALCIRPSTSCHTAE